jgi:hypothetical protein
MIAIAITFAGLLDEIKHRGKTNVLIRKPVFTG